MKANKLSMMEYIAYSQHHYMITDLHSRVIAANDFTAKRYGHDNKGEIIGTTARDAYDEETAINLLKQDQYVMSTMSALTIFDIYRTPEGVAVTLLTRKSPFIVEDNLAGVEISCIDISENTCMNLSSVLMKLNDCYAQQSLKRLNGSKKLSPREKECLYYWTYGKTMEQIAETLSIKPSVVQEYITRAKFKTGCNTKSELIGYAISSGYLNFLTEKNLKNNMTVILDQSPLL